MDALTRRLDAEDEGMGGGRGGKMSAAAAGKLGRSLAQLDAEARARLRAEGGVASSAASGMAGAVGKKRTASSAAGELGLGGGWSDDDGGDGDGGDGGSDGGDGGGRRRGGDDEEVSEDPFYAAVEAAAARKRARKAEVADRARSETADFIRTRKDEYDLDEGGDQHRRAGREIMKNRGLTKYRKREERNPRVHNRMKAEKFTKRRKGQVAPMRNKAEEAGSYGGEATGIRTNISRSRKIHA